MAKIALISEHLSSQTLGLAQALTFHRHDVIIITSAGEEVPDAITYPVLRFFKTWSAWEALKFFPHLLSQAPDVWHFVFARDHHGDALPKTAHLILAQLAKALPRRVVASSFYDSLYETAARKLVAMLKSSDIVTTATREQLMFIKRRSWIKNYCETEVLPPFSEKSSHEDQNILDPDLIKLVQNMSPYLLIPNERLSPLLSEDSLFTQLLKKKNLLVCGSRPNLKMKQLGLRSSHPEIAFVGSRLTEAQQSYLLKHSQGMLISFEDFSAVELLQFHRLCSKAKKALITNRRQAEALPGISLHGKNGFVLDQGLASLIQLLGSNPDLKLQEELFQSVSTDLTDSALNELNRLYSKVQHIKSTAIDSRRSAHS